MMNFIFCLLVILDMLGSFDTNELYQSLIVDAGNVEVAGTILDAAHHDPRVTPGQFEDLHEIYILNFSRNQND